MLILSHNGTLSQTQETLEFRQWKQVTIWLISLATWRKPWFFRLISAGNKKDFTSCGICFHMFWKPECMTQPVTHSEILYCMWCLLGTCFHFPFFTKPHYKTTSSFLKQLIHPVFHMDDTMIGCHLRSASWKLLGIPVQPDVCNTD